ncbi:uncharacterized protein KZ484_011010 [Pholidichthys leucotaenia]
MKLQTTTDFPEQHVCENEFSPDQQLWNQEENLGLEQDEPEPPRVKEEQEELEPTWVKEEQEELEPIHVKEEQNELEPPQVKVEPNELELPQVKEEPNELELPQVKEEQNEQEPPQVKEELNELEPPQVKEEEEELSISQEGEQLKLKLEVDIFMVPLISEDKQQSEAEPNSEQLLSHQSAGTEIQDEQGSWHVDSGSTKEEEEPKPKKRRLKTRSHHEDAPQLHDYKEEGVTVQQLCNQERNSNLDQEEQDAARGKEEEELCTSQEEEHFGLKQETDTFMVTPTDEDNENSETEPNSEQLLSHNSPDTESQDRGPGKNVNPGSSKHEEPKQNKRCHRNRSDSNNAYNSSMSKNHCDTATGEESVKCSVSDKDCKNESQKKKHYTVAKSHVCKMCGKRFRLKRVLSVHEGVHTENS